MITIFKFRLKMCSYIELERKLFAPTYPLKYMTIKIKVNTMEI